jgi:hypothetical protein
MKQKDAWHPHLLLRNYKCLNRLTCIPTTTNNQAFYSQASWGRLEMKPHESKKQVQNKSEKEGEKQRVINKPNQKRRKDNKTLSQKRKKGPKKNLTKGNKRKEPKIKVLAYELLDSTLSYLMLAP